MTQDPSAKAREVVEAWQTSDFYGEKSERARYALAFRIAAALRDADQRGFERGVEASAAIVKKYGADETSMGSKAWAAIRQLLATEREGRNG